MTKSIGKLRIKKEEMKSIYIDYTKPILRGGNCATKKDLDAEIRKLEKEGWTVEFGKYDGINKGGFRYWFEATKMEKIEKGECPRCKSKNIIDIVYGYPTAKAMKEAEKGKIHLGGCCVSPDNPIHYCKDCGKEFLKRSVVQC